MGGGGGGGRGLTPREIERLEGIAKQTLTQGAATGKHNVFISFVEDDLKEVNLLRGQAKNENSDIEFNDFSLRKPFDSKDAEYIKSGIRERIRQSSVTIVFVSEKTADSRWVDWEIRESFALGKGVVAMYSGSRPPSRLPNAMIEYRKQIRLVPWKQEELAKAISSAST